MKFGSSKLFASGFGWALVALLNPLAAWAFPEMVRHGYINCTSCHVSPSGGGVLTQYGRALSGEVLSYASRIKETEFAYGAIQPPDWLLLGGDVRILGFYRENSSFVQGQIFPMQTDLEAAATFGKFSLVGSLGYQRATGGTPVWSDYLISRRHYLVYRPGNEVSARVGRFLPAFGINTPDHAITTKKGLGWNAGSETYNVELAWLNEKFNLYGTAIAGRPDAVQLDREKGVAVSASVAAFETHKIGMSYFYGANSTGNRHVVGPFGILGFTPHFFLLTELDFQGAQNGSSDRQWGIVNYQRLDYEFFQGFHGYLTQELSRLNFLSSDTLTKAYGIGIQFFPRPHWEINCAWQIQINALQTGYTDFGYFLLHFYP